MLLSIPDEQEFYDTTQNMITYGGDFVHSLGKLMRLADPTNRMKLIDAFSSYWTKYQKFSGEDQKDISTAALSFFGERSQVTKCCEELAELSVELCKWHNQTEDADEYHIQEEIADVQIMLDQMVVMFDCQECVNTIKQSKIERLRGLIS
jgi:hypothetical protein